MNENKLKCEYSLIYFSLVYDCSFRNFPAQTIVFFKRKDMTKKNNKKLQKLCSKNK